MAKKKDYTTGSRKWLIILSVLVLVAIIAVVIVLLVPGNTYSMVEVLHSHSTTSFLNVDNTSERENYDKLKAEFDIAVTGYKQEVEDIETLSQTINNVLDFYDEYTIFAKNNGTLTQNYKSIKSNLNKASRLQDDMNEEIVTLISLSDNSDTYQRNAWIDLRVIYVDWLENMQNAIARLNTCYQNCFDPSLTNNTASTLVLNAVDDYISVITDDFNDLIENDQKSSRIESYNYTMNGRIKLFEAYVNARLTSTNFVNYIFHQRIKNFYDDVNQFYTVYSQEDFKYLLDSIAPNGAFTENFDDVNVSGSLTCLANTKTFLSGGDI